MLSITGNAKLNAINGNLTIYRGTANLGNTWLKSGNNITIAGWVLTGTGALDMDAANAILIAGSTITTTGDVTKTAHDIFVTDSTITTDGDLNKIAGNDISVEGSIIEAGGDLSKTAGNDIFVEGSTITTTADGNLSKTAGNDIYVSDSKIMADGNLNKIAGNDISVEDSDITAGGNLKKTAENELSIAGSDLTVAGNTNLTSTNGNLTISDGKANFGGDTQLKSGSNLSIADWELNNTGKLDMTAEKNISVTGSDLIAGDTTMTAKGDLSIVGTTVSFESAMLKGNNVTILNSPQFDVHGNLGIDAANRLTAMNVVGRIGGITGDNGIADFDALGFHLFSWHFYTKTVLLAGIDIYNDPIYWNSLAYDRIIRNINGGFGWNMSGNQDEDEWDELIDGSWLPEEDVTLEALEDIGQIGIPVAAVQR